MASGTPEHLCEAHPRSGAGFTCLSFVWHRPFDVTGACREGGGSSLTLPRIRRWGGCWLSRHFLRDSPQISRIPLENLFLELIQGHVCAALDQVRD